MTNNRITFETYPKELTLSLPEFLERFDLSLKLVETRTGDWIAQLVGAKVPEYKSYRMDRIVPESDLLTNRCAKRDVLEKAAESLTLKNKLIRTDGSEIDIRNIKVTT